MTRANLWKWLVRNVPEGNILPWHLLVVMFILYPSRILLWISNRYYDPMSDTYTIEGVKVSAIMMRHFAYGGSEWFRIVKRDNGCVTIEKKMD